MLFAQSIDLHMYKPNLKVTSESLSVCMLHFVLSAWYTLFILIFTIPSQW